MMAVAALVGSVSVYTGLLLSYHADLAGGASVVAVAVGIFLVTFAITEVRRSVGARRGTRTLAHTHGGEHGHHH
jgi:ABC-type Mn2+/Zn2+ transport system permease subunit